METVDAYPAKRFFVEMLVRDIELKDSILDLLDNCVDGAMRTAQGTTVSSERPYEHRWAKIKFNADEFSIEDNCGGIPISLAKGSAFSLGRTDPTMDADLPTVGVYGIGMKRAIFKIGKNSIVESKTEQECFVVTIDSQWMEDDKNWQLPFDDSNCSLEEAGTRILISELRDGMSRLFSDETDFEEDLKKTIAAYYGLIIGKGFTVYVNGEKVEPIQFALLIDDAAFTSSQGIAPYVYQANKDGVSVTLAIGFYRNLPTEDEENEILNGKPSTEKAGITVVCNDRVVIYADKTRLTGWGEATVPQYHTQFVSIGGIVVFRSNDASKLPLASYDYQAGNRRELGSLFDCEGRDQGRYQVLHRFH